MNKQFTYKNFNFNINVKLNTKIEKRMNGKKYHTITTNIFLDDYYGVEVIEDEFLVESILNHEILVKKYIDDKLNNISKLDVRLVALGFK